MVGAQRPTAAGCSSWPRSRGPLATRCRLAAIAAFAAVPAVSCMTGDARPAAPEVIDVGRARSVVVTGAAASMPGGAVVFVRNPGPGPRRVRAVLAAVSGEGKGLTDSARAAAGPARGRDSRTHSRTHSRTRSRTRSRTQSRMYPPARARLGRTARAFSGSTRS